MPITDSMSLLWMSYGFLSLVVLLTGYLGLAFLPRLPRLVITWLVAGVMWMPAHFRLPLIEEGEFYTGFAPAIMVAAVGFLEGNASTLALLLVVVGAAAGAAFGAWLWWRGWRRHRADESDGAEKTERRAPSRRNGEGSGRQEPVIG